MLIVIPDKIIKQYKKANKEYFEGDSCALTPKQRVNLCENFMEAKAELEQFIYNAID